MLKYGRLCFLGYKKQKQWKKKIAVLGSTGSIGKSTLDIIKKSWGDIIIELEKINAKIAHFLEDVVLTQYNNSELVLKLVSGNRFQLTALEKDINQIETVLFTLLILEEYFLI